MDRDGYCQCGCGQKTSIVVNNCAKSGRVKGQPSRFVHGHTSRKHGGCETPEYAAWAHIVQRCTNPKNKYWHNYGGRGISICPEWRDDFSAFLAHVGSRPSPKHGIDRYPNNDGNYEPGNVRWATAKEQTRNFRRNRLITHNGKTAILVDWAKEFGVSYQALQKQLARGTFPAGRAAMGGEREGKREGI